MQITTRQGTVLTVQLTALQRIPSGHPQPIVEFRYSGGMRCSDYYLSTFQGIPAGEGLCLISGTYSHQDLSPESVAACQAYCAAVMTEALK